MYKSGRPRFPDRWPSGLRHTLGKRAWCNSHRGFESRPVRHFSLPRLPLGRDIARRLPHSITRHNGSSLLLWQWNPIDRSIAPGGGEQGCFVGGDHQADRATQPIRNDLGLAVRQDFPHRCSAIIDHEHAAVLRRGHARARRAEPFAGLDARTVRTQNRDPTANVGNDIAGRSERYPSATSYISIRLLFYSGHGGARR